MSTRASNDRGIQFRVLGPLEVDAGDGPVPLGGPKQRAVLANLLIRANQVVSAEMLIDELWGEEPPEGARHTLQTYVSNLRKALGEDRLQGRPPGYTLILDPLELDASRFDLLVRDAKHALAVDPQVAIATLDDALALWRGPALADVADRPSLLAEAARLDELRIDAQERRIEGLLASGAQATAIGELETLLAHEPLRESLWGLLMLALYREGRQGDALNAYQRAREILAEELGIDPSPSLGRLNERILKQDPGLDLQGERLRGYRLLEQIGDGPIGTVFRAIQPHVGRDVAIKLFHEHVATDPAFVRRFEPEAQSVAALEHPHIVPLYDYWREPGRAYMVSRYLRGGSLRGLKERGGPIAQDRALRLVEQVASALAFVHRQGMAHGNLSTSNVLLDGEGNAYLGDFRAGVGAGAAATEDVVGLARLAADLLGADAPGHIAELVDRAEVGVDVPEAGAFAEAARATLEPEAPRPSGYEARNPFKGLRAFTEADTRDFFGRGELIARLVSRMNETDPGSRFLAVVGPSGNGKSSVVHAGLVPSIRGGVLSEATDRSITEMSPGVRPIEELAAALLRIAVRPTPRLFDILDGGSRGLLEAVDLVAPDGAEVVLVVDQFEELFTLAKDERERELFLELLRVATMDPRSRVRIIVTLRADFYDRPLQYPRFGELLAARNEAVPPLTPDELEQAIRKPAEQEGVHAEPGLVAEMIADVAHQRGGLPLLQYALTELFERREDERLTQAAYREIGGIAGALSARAERSYAATDPEGRRATKQVFLRLVTLGEGRQDTRRRVPASELDDLDVDPAAIEAVLDGYGRQRLLTFDREPSTREPTVEIAHEALLGAWERLRGWIDDAREDVRQERRLARAGAEWRGAQEDPSFLLHGARLEQVEGWAATTDLAIGRRERSYLWASVEQRDRAQVQEEERRRRELLAERRSRRTLRGLVAVFAAAALVAGSLTIVATNQSARAERGERIATARGLAAAAVASLQDDPERGILLAIQAVEQTRSVDGTVLPEAEEALHRAVTASRVVMTVPGLGGAVDWSPDGVFVTQGPKGAGSIDIRDGDTGESALPPFRGHGGDITDVAFSPDGSMLATTGEDGALKVWDPSTGDLISRAVFPGGASGVSFSGDGSLVAAGWNRVSRVVDPSTGEVADAFHTGGDTALGPDGRQIAIKDWDGIVTVMNVEAGDRATRTLDAKIVNAMAWSPDGRSIATVGSSGVGEIWSAATGRLEDTLFGQKGFVDSVAWSRDSSRLVTGGTEGAVKVWRIGRSGAQELMSLSANETRSGVAGVAFSPNGNQVLAGNTDRSAVKIWDVGAAGSAEIATLPSSPTISNVAIAPDGRLVYVPSGRESVAVWDIEARAIVRTIGVPGHPSWPRSGNPAVDLSSDGTSLAIAGGKGDVSAYDTRTGDRLFTVPLREPLDPVWSRDGMFLVTAQDVSESASVVDRTGRVISVLRVAGDRITSVAFSPDGSVIATSTRDGVRLWDWAHEVVVRTIDAPRGKLAFDPSGTRLAIASGEVTEILDVQTGARLALLAGHAAAIWDVAFSPDGSRVATSGIDGTIRLFDASSGDQQAVLYGHTGLVSAIAFSGAGRRLASYGTVLGDRPATFGVQVWALNIDELLEIARQELTRPMLDEECRQYLHLEGCPA